ncbi:hypothetical protein [Haloarchaeobius sp. DFWS5]|uniref:hypothetical protein n=1 Tax=Haloarchaeobius sp. DFWS5 TaxID=3446114 RepID=UPI003EB838F9
MPVYDRGGATEFEVIDEWEAGVGWVAHPDEEGRRASHAIHGENGDVWLFDPLDAPGVESLYDELGPVAGVAVFSDWHTRDAAVFASRHDVPVFVPSWLDRVADKLHAADESVDVVRYDRDLGTSGFEVRRVDPFPGWHEAVAYRDSDETLYAADVLGTVMGSTVGDERVGFFLLLRPAPPVAPFVDRHPERILVGHGAGVFDDATAALTDAVTGARRRFPRTLANYGVTQFRGLVGALWN